MSSHAQTALTTEIDSAARPTLYMALELAQASWKIGFTDGRPRPRVVQVPGGDVLQLAAEITLAKERFRLPAESRIVSCYEAGRDGFWLHRHLVSSGIENVIVDPGSIEVNRRHRRAKTDRIDVLSLTSRLVRYDAGEEGVWSVLRVPSVEDEDARELHRELKQLQKEILQHKFRITSLLFKHGLRVEVTGDFARTLKELRLQDGCPLPAGLTSRLRREHQRLRQAHRQKLALEAERRKMLRAPSTERLQKVVDLQKLHGIGMGGSWLLVMEFFGWRQFRNRREVAAAAGLTPTPYASGDSEREQGISKAGNSWVRSMMIELAWCWLRFQPQSRHSLWFHEKFGEGRRRRRVGIVALARRLLIDLWRFVEQGVVPDAAVMSA